MTTWRCSNPASLATLRTHWWLAAWASCSSTNCAFQSLAGVHSWQATNKNHLQSTLKPFKSPFQEASRRQVNLKKQSALIWSSLGSKRLFF
jgi:hypothetical protein